MHERLPAESKKERLEREIAELESQLARVEESIQEILAEQRKRATEGVAMSLEDEVSTKQALAHFYAARNAFIESIAAKKIELRRLT